MPTPTVGGQQICTRTAASLCHSSSRNVPPSLFPPTYHSDPSSVSEPQFCFSPEDSHFCVSLTKFPSGSDHFHQFQRPNSPFLCLIGSICCLHIQNFQFWHHDAPQVRFGRHQLSTVLAAIAEAASVLCSKPISGFKRWRQIVRHASHAGLQQPSGKPIAPFLRPPLAGLLRQPGFGFA